MICFKINFVSFWSSVTPFPSVKKRWRMHENSTDARMPNSEETETKQRNQNEIIQQERENIEFSYLQLHTQSSLLLLSSVLPSILGFLSPLLFPPLSLSCFPCEESWEGTKREGERRGEGERESGDSNHMNKPVGTWEGRERESESERKREREEERERDLESFSNVTTPFYLHKIKMSMKRKERDRNKGRETCRVCHSAILVSYSTKMRFFSSNLIWKHNQIIKRTEMWISKLWKGWLSDRFCWEFE